VFDPEALLNLEELRAMDDGMLKRWGVAAHMCTPEANLGGPPREVFVVQLQEARAEWRRRHPKDYPLEE
jgi:hypothetical protein